MSVKKFEDISGLYRETAAAVAASPQKWMELLTSGGYNYKLRFDEQLLVYAQKPDATAVLETSRWNRVFRRWVNKGVAGIAVFAEPGGEGGRLRYFWDISDTHEGYNAKPVPQWEMQPEYAQDIMEALEDGSGIVSGCSTLGSALKAAAEIATVEGDTVFEALAALDATRAGTPLEKMSDEDLYRLCATLIADSTGYMLLKRCGLDAGRYYAPEDFIGLRAFSSVQTLDALGAAVNATAKPLLRTIARTVEIQSAERRKNYGREQRAAQVQVQSENRDNLRAGRGLLLPGIQAAGGEGSAAGGIRHAAQELAHGEQAGALRGAAGTGRDERAPVPSGAESRGDGGALDAAAQGESGRDREAEGGGSNALGRSDEQHTGSGAGDRGSGSHIHGISRDPSEAEQKEYILSKAEQERSAFSFSQEEIDAVLLWGSSFSQGKMRIYEQFQKGAAAKENAAFLKAEYGIGGCYPVAEINGRKLNENHNGKGIEILCGEERIQLSWSQVSKRIGELIAADRYLNAAEKEKYPEFLAERNPVSEAETQPQADMEYRFSVGDHVYIGSTEYEVSSIDKDSVSLFEPQYPLFGVEFTREEFEQKLRENPLNDTHLKPVEQHKKQSLQEKPSLTQEYSRIKEEYPASVLLYQHGDFFVAFHEDAKTLGDLLGVAPSTQDMAESLEAPMQLSSARLQLIINLLNDRGFDVAVSTLEDGERTTRNIISTCKDDPVESQPVGRIDYIGTNGAVDESFEYTSEYQFLKDIKEENFYGSPMRIVLYRNGSGETISQDFLSQLEPPPQGFEIVDLRSPPYILCEWSESNTFEDGKIYSVYEFDRLMKQADDEYVAGKAAAMEKYGTWQKWYDANDPEYGRFLGYDKTRFTLVLADGRRFTERQDIGDGVGGVLDFLSKYDIYRSIIPILQETVAQEKERLDIKEPQAADITNHEPEVKPPKSGVSPVFVSVGGEWTEFPSAAEAEKAAYEEYKAQIKVAAQNFHITDDHMGEGGQKAKFQANVDAIKLLKYLEETAGQATPEQQEVLSRYVGWGGLADCFDERHSRYGELKSLLTEDEYTAARESTLTAFYTPPAVIKAMYEALENMGFKTGNILEPSCGVGNFMGLLPESMSEAKMYGVELDSVSGRIAKQLYPKNNIAVQGFEETPLPDSFFDAAIGNVPFGQFKVPDKRYDQHNFLIHDYFFAKTLDKVRPGGIIAFITSKGTMDKANPSVRKYIAQRAELLGAIRLPNDTFKAAAGTEVTSDIIFLQKRDTLVYTEPDWVHLGVAEGGLRYNSYFVQHPEMVLGEMKEISGAHGMETACIALDGQDFAALLHEAVSLISGQITDYEAEKSISEESISIPADPSVRNFSYTVVDGDLYYRENSRMEPIKVSPAVETRIKGMLAIRDCTRQLIEYQTEDYEDGYIRTAQAQLNELYDDYTAKYGRLSSRANMTAMSKDSSASLLVSLEVTDDEGNFVRKADMFSKRTIKRRQHITAVDTATEALALSLSEKAKIDMEYMVKLTGKDEKELLNELKGVIFLNPEHTHENDHHEKYLPADEYLSGNVREKLAWAERSAKLYPEDYAVNVEALKAVQPVDLTPGEISVRLGATWLSPDIIEAFMFELLETPAWARWKIHARYSEYTGEWNIEGKSHDRSSVKSYTTYGTDRINAYRIIEETLNLRDVRIFDYIDKKAILNKKETAIAQGKQELIKQEFQDWIWKEPQRREQLTKLYNERFNSFRPREYDGSHLSFPGSNPEITLRPHQVNAIARILYGGNTLLAHVVGAGKTYEMVAAAMESKRLGICQKSMFVVPNHLTEQWAAEFLQLYPAANVLVATRKDFEAKNRKKFCSRIATGDYDAVIIGHSQFEKIPMSIERQRIILEQQLDEIIDGVSELKRNSGDSFSIKQLERTRKTVKLKLEKLNDQSRKDDVITFEELGVDRLFIDEAHYYKNLAVFTKMRNVAGISQTEAQKSSDLYMKCRYLDELTGGRGIVFATGTPISNSMVELYTMQKYLQYGTLKRNGLEHFDAWASTFGETVTAIELAPEGTGYRSKTRFAKFYNLPELMAMFREVADIQTADMLKLPVPEAHFHNVVLPPSEIQKELVQALSVRAEKVRSKMVDSSEDNMLLITNDGRKLALDQRLINPLLPDSSTGKVSACADNVFEMWQRTAAQRSTQMVFCDLSTPHGDGKFNVYDDLRDELVAKGIPKEEIAYIHSASTEAAKKELFGKVRSGQVRVLIGSTQKMGAGTNVQDRLIALHHLDCPWRPSDLQQREGRIIRQGNGNDNVDIYTYVTENTFDSYLYQLVESKQKFIGQIMTGKSPVRSAEDVDEQALSYAEIKALCAGNPLIKEKMDLDIVVQRLKLLKASHLSQRYALEDKIAKEFPARIAQKKSHIAGLERDLQTVREHPRQEENTFRMQIGNYLYNDKGGAGRALIRACKNLKSAEELHLGLYRGFEIALCFNSFEEEYLVKIRGSTTQEAILGDDPHGNIQRIDNAIDRIELHLKNARTELADTEKQLETAKIEVKKPFPRETELKEKSARLDELNIQLNLDKRDNELVDGEPEEAAPERSEKENER